ncbi:mycofactocin biosynthesis glycosyltransferase MftF [Actinocorallia populi]|uniref:mycofactocin biosynthesis glycosyltransferase MftF n=1 Tax=Actinocorallia populi TaxID=2079200 RepID=UPI000D08C695|nr:mycofactocin biosynthesis glycosyltransferase MftF [Actinocorallia populi]
MTRSFALPQGFPVALDSRTSFWGDGLVATGGAPWKVVRLKEAARPHLREWRRAGGEGVAVSSAMERALGRQLLDLGFAHPVPSPRPGPHEVTVVVPAFGRTDELERCLTAVKGVPVIVVDDGSPDPEPMRRVAEAYGVRLERHAVNRGPAAARNTGLRLARTPFVAFVDSDCRPEEGWLDLLLPHFDDPKVAAVAPRIVPDGGGRGAMARYEAARSALDMGTRPALVRPGAKLGFVPTATLVVRREAVADLPFDEGMRLGEDVDFVWRLADRGLNVRYQPEARVAHTPRLALLAWARRRHEYGTSAAALAERHPGRLAPAHLSGWNLLTLGCLALGRPLPAAASAALTAVLLDRSLAGMPGSRTLSASVVGKGVVADAAALGHALRREWWPLGLVCLAAGGRSRLARGAAAAMLAPVALEWCRRPALDPVRYTALRLAEDVAYGSGVAASALRHRSLRPLLPSVRLPRPGRRG